MSNIKRKPIDIGLNLAHQHRSALSQAKAADVYAKINVAKVHDDKLPANVRISRGIRAIRMGIDRISRLGERVREDKNVSPADHKLMKEEFAFLKTQLKTIFKREMGQSYAFNEDSDFKLNEVPEQFGRIVDSVYSGDIKLADKFNHIGTLLDPDADPAILNFEGKFMLKDTLRSVDIVTGVESLSSKYQLDGVASPIPLQGELAGENYVDLAVQRVSRDVLNNARSSLRTHINKENYVDMSLLFDDGSGNSVV